MEKILKEEPKITGCHILRFIPYLNRPEDKKNDMEKTAAEFTFDYDYIQQEKFCRHIFIDAGIDAPALAKAKIRVCFEINCNFGNPFEIRVLKDLNKTAIETAKNEFERFCTGNNFPYYPEIFGNKQKTIQPQLQKMLQLSAEREHFLKPAPGKGLMTMKPGVLNSLVTDITFFILDEVLYNNPDFDTANNCAEFHSVVPEAVYYTVKLKSMELARTEICLPFYHNLMFQVCLDCALKIITNPALSEKMYKAFLKQYINPDDIKQYIKRTGQKLYQLNSVTCKMAREAGFHVWYEWAEAIRVVG